MADVSNLRRLNHIHQSSPPQSRRPISTNATLGLRQERTGLPEEFYYQPTPLLFDLDSFSPPHNPPGSYYLDDYPASFSFGFDTSSETEDPDSEDDDDADYLVYGSDEDAEQMNFLTDLFESRETQVAEDPNWEVDSDRVDGSGLEFGFGPGLGSSNVDICDLGMDLESDSDEFVVNTGFINNDDEDYDSFEGNNDVYLSANEREEFEWEEVMSERNNSEEREILNSVIDRIEEISVSSEISSSDSSGSSRLGDDEGEEEEGNIEWEVLLAMNDLERNLEWDNSIETVERDNLAQDYILSIESDALFGQLVENEDALKSCPPAAKSVVEKLPSVVLTKDEVGENGGSVACAVCMDEFPIGEKLTRMPCFHLYHRDCILPWLRSRNTCPICRFELPTDDANYEARRCARRGGRLPSHLAHIFEARYNAYLLA